MRWFTRLRRPINSATLGGLLTLFIVVLWGVDQYAQPFFLAPLSRLERLAYDWRFLIRPPQMPGPEVVVAAIDDKSIDKLGRWPWPYTEQAKLVQRLGGYGVKAIGYDVVFDAPDKTGGLEKLQQLQAQLGTAEPGLAAVLDKTIAEADHNEIFARALQASGRTVLGYAFHWWDDDIQYQSLEQKQDSWQNIYGAEHVYFLAASPEVPLQQMLQQGAMKKAVSVIANLSALSQAVCTKQASGQECNSGFFNSSQDVDGATRQYPLAVYFPRPRSSQADQEKALPGQPVVQPVYTPLGISVLKLVGLRTTVKLDFNGVQVAALNLNTDEIYSIPTDHLGRMLINYLGPSELTPAEADLHGRRYRFPRYSIADILSDDPQAREKAPPEAFRGKIVLVGATAVGLGDLRVTPVDPALPGVETHATVIDNILHRRFLAEPSWSGIVTGAFILLLGLCLTLLVSRLGPLRGDLVTLALAAGTLWLNYALFTHGWLLNIVYPLWAIAVVWGVLTIYHYVFEQKQGRFLRKTFSTYLHPELVNQMVRDRIEPALGGSSGIRTAYFTDIQSFSSFSEILSAEDLVELLNEYLTKMTDILEAEGGTLDKFEGDAIVAFFGAPVEQPDHAARALRVALRMQQGLGELREKWRGEGDRWPALVHDMRMRIGINSGDIVTGNMGSTKRFNYTMMGDVVNTAARLEASAKQYGIYIQCTRETLDLAGPDDFEWREIDKVKVVGKSEAVETIEIMAAQGQMSYDLVAMRSIYHQGLALYRQQQWEEALARFTESEKREEVFPKRPTTPSRVYIERCTYFKENPPGPDWDGSWALLSK